MTDNVNFLTSLARPVPRQDSLKTRHRL